MAVLMSATCSLCGARLTGVGLRTGDAHLDGRCTAPIVVERAWSLALVREWVEFAVPEAPAESG
jgi:hypothetical protein